MSSVPVSKRNPTDFEAPHHFYQLRDEVTQLMITNFGFSYEKYSKSIEKYREMHKDAENVDEIVNRWKTRADAFNNWFITKEREAVLKILRDIESEFTFGNSIYPSDTPARFFEIIERRKHIDAAIANCYVLKQEIQYIIRTLPVDMNRYINLDKKINTQVALYKGVRRADNRFFRSKKKTVDITKDISAIAESVLAIINKVMQGSL